MTDEKKTDEKTKAVSKKGSTAVAKQSDKPKGFENEDAKDLLLPRVELLQGLSPAVQEGKGKAGDIVNQISKTSLPTDVFIPITMQRRYIKWIPRDQGGGIEYQTSDPNDDRVKRDTQWGSAGEKPTCTAYINFLIIMEGESLPLVLSFSMTNYQEGRKLYTMCKMANCDMFKRKYKVASKGRQNQMGTWHVFDISEVGESSPEDAKMAEDLYEAFNKAQFNVDLDTGSSTNVKAGKDEDF